MFEIAVGYASTRKQFGKPIASYQLVKARPANLRLGNHVARHLTDIELSPPMRAPTTIQSPLVGRDITGVRSRQGE